MKKITATLLVAVGILIGFIAENAYRESIAHAAVKQSRQELRIAVDNAHVKSRAFFDDPTAKSLAEMKLSLLEMRTACRKQQEARDERDEVVRETRKCNWVVFRRVCSNE